jgi:adenylosuccinate lyase
MINELINNLRNVVFDEEQIEKNLNLTKGACLAEKIMVNLVNKGIGRQESHEILRKAAIKAKNENMLIKDILAQNKEIMSKISIEELEDLLDPRKYIGGAINLAQNLVNYIKNKYKF